jgi:hypothetical protein
MSAFKGVWIEAAVFQRNDLTDGEKLLWGYMNSFKHFHASDAHIAAVMGKTVGTIKNTMSRLRTKGYVTGHNKTRQPCLPQTSLLNDPKRSQNNDFKGHNFVTIEQREKKEREQSKEVTKIRVEPGVKAPVSLAHETNEPIAAMKPNPDDTVAASPPPPRPPIDVNALYDSIFIEPDRKAKEAAAREVAALKAKMKPQLDAMRRAAEDAYADELAAQRDREREEDAAAEREEERGDYY